MMFGFGWKPREGIVYRSWCKGDSHFGKSATVRIILNGQKEQEGTFSVKGSICEIRTDSVPRMLTPVSNVSFSKKIKNIDSIFQGKQLGQNGYCGKEIRYVVKVKNLQEDD